VEVVEENQETEEMPVVAMLAEEEPARMVDPHELEVEEQ